MNKSKLYLLFCQIGKICFLVCCRIYIIYVPQDEKSWVTGLKPLSLVHKCPQLSLCAGQVKYHSAGWFVFLYRKSNFHPWLWLLKLSSDVSVVAYVGTPCWSNCGLRRVSFPGWVYNPHRHLCRENKSRSSHLNPEPCHRVGPPASGALTCIVRRPSRGHWPGPDPTPGFGMGSPYPYL